MPLRRGRTFICYTPLNQLRFHVFSALKLPSSRPASGVCKVNLAPPYSRCSARDCTGSSLPTLFCILTLPRVFLNCDIPFNETWATLTLFLFALTIQNMDNAYICNAGFFRPDHDPPCRPFCASIYYRQTSNIPGG